MQKLKNKNGNTENQGLSDSTVYIILGLICIIFLPWFYYYFAKVHECIQETTIRRLTDRWCDEVTVKHDSTAISELFCKDGILIGTFFADKRNKDIKVYFDHFANLPNITILAKKYYISKVSDNVFVNTAYITWSWGDEGGDINITSRMTFVYRGMHIFQLHSCVLPSENMHSCVLPSENKNLNF